MIETLLHRTADRVEADPALAENVRGLVRRARRRRGIAVAGAAVAVVAAGSVVFAGPVRDWLDDGGPAPAAIVVAQPARSPDLTSWRWRDVPPPDPTTSGNDVRAFVVGHSLVSLDYDDGHYVASVSGTAGEPFGPARPASPTTLTSAVSAASDTTLYLWGGQDTARGTPAQGPTYPPSGLAFDVASQTWSKLPQAPIESRDGAVAVWTGDRLLIWGGTVGAAPNTGTPSRIRADGAGYDPATGTWEVLPPAPGGGSLVPVAAVWSGERMVVWARAQDDSSGPESGRTLVFDPAARTWSVAAGPPVPAAGASLVATAAGPLAVSVLFEQSRAARFDATTDRWVALPGPAVPTATICPTSVVALLEPAVAVALPSCAGGTPQLLDETSGAWVPLPSWGTGLTGVAGAGGDFLALWNPAGRSVPGASPSLRVLSAP
ncbi:hypothetical protein [Frankia sp. QA3]|uniref:hypothetical protein n=1 Tax=Frankia sp. QA3 TaxID=710111 RepID=UPI0018DED9C1|nr:hypothetical protein [Frankia sp. QA3]